MSGIALKDLLEAGVHFGHQTKRWNPKMKQYIFGERNGIYIIDLGKTAKLFRDAEQFDVFVTTDGGGVAGQAGAVRLGIARALCVFNIELRPRLKKAGLLTRDARIKERKKYGQKGARKRFQFSKR